MFFNEKDAALLPDYQNISDRDFFLLYRMSSVSKSFAKVTYKNLADRFIQYADGVTITGTGTQADPWTAVGGGGGQVDSIVAGTNISVDDSDPVNPIVNFALGLDENFVTDAEKIVIANTSNTNTGDQSSGDFDHDALQNTHNLSTDIDHDGLTNTHTKPPQSGDAADTIVDDDTIPFLQFIGGLWKKTTWANIKTALGLNITATKTLTVTDNTTLNGGTHSGTNTGDQDVSGIEQNYFLYWKNF